MTPLSCYEDLRQFYSAYLERVQGDPGRLFPELSAKVDQLQVIGEKIACRTPGRFSRRGDVVFMAMALPILASLAAGERVELSSLENCIRAYSDMAGDKPIEPPEAKETQFCLVRNGPCAYCVDRFRECRHFYEVD